MRRFIPPRIGDTKRIRPLVNAHEIMIQSAEGSEEGYYCLPVFCYNSQIVELYITKEFEGSGGLLAKLYELIEEENFSEYDVTIEMRGSQEQIGKNYVDGKGILFISKLTKSKWPITRYEKPRLDEMQQVVEEYEKQKETWKGKYGK